MTTPRIYEIYPSCGGFSVKIADYSGTAFTVSATSVRQAYAVAFKRAWINPTDHHPVGVVSIYRRGLGMTLWCGCSGHGITGGEVAHGAGITALRKAIEAHDVDCTRRVPTLRERLRAANTQAQP